MGAPDGLRLRLACERFRCEAVLWLDLSPPAPELAAGRLGHLLALSQHAGGVIESFRAHHRLARANHQLHGLNQALRQARTRIDRELAQARDLQRSLLPRSFPEGLVRDRAIHYRPAGKVGGDYYHGSDLGDGRLGLAVADVSGHGVAAALVMSMFKILLNTFARPAPAPSEVLGKINRAFVEELGGPQYVSAFYGVLSAADRRLRYCNAGHVPPLLVEPGRPPRELGATGAFLGVFDDPSLADGEIELAPGARLILYTDGMAEAGAMAGAFGLEQLRALADRDRGLGAGAAAAAILEARDRHGDPEGLPDDRTLIILDL